MFVLIFRCVCVHVANCEPIAQILFFSGHPHEFPAGKDRLRGQPQTLDHPLLGHGRARLAVRLVQKALHSLFEVLAQFCLDLSVSKVSIFLKTLSFSLVNFLVFKQS
jgi:hypothetical protein